MHLIQDGVYIRPFIRFINTYVLKTPEGVVIVDTALNGGQMHKLVNELSSIGISTQDVSAIFITHVHPDHVGGLPTLVNILSSHVKVIAHRIEAPIARGDASVANANPKDFSFPLNVIVERTPSKNNSPARVDLEVSEGDLVGGVFEVVELPGHSYGHSGLWWPEKRLLIGADVMMNLPVRGLTAPPKAFSSDWRIVIQSIQKVAQMEVETLCLGHGPTIRGGAAQKIKKLSARLK
jgi:glyoxylase-like metal-dependent hydrolase (beta-lactamase superfamily II)